MMGHSHLVANTCAGVIIGTGIYSIEEFYRGPFHKQICGGVSIFHDYILNHEPSFMPYPVWICICVFLFYLGTLLPDIDSRNSLLGRFIYVPLEHRTWTHTIWIPAIFGILSIWIPVLCWLFFGYISHLFFDAFSASGVCFIYPISTYRKFGPDGAKVKKTHPFKLYYTGKTSEYVFLGFLCMFTVIVVVCTLQKTGRFPVIDQLTKIMNDKFR